jgi:plastocyanin
MERNEAVKAYLDNQISRRVFVRKMTAAGVSLGSAIAYANLLVPKGAEATEAASVFYAEQVWVYDFRYEPAVEPARQGDLVPWAFYGSIPHTVSDSTGMHLFDSGLRAAGAHYVFEFDAAGTYPYRCLDLSHPPMMAVVQVPTKAKPHQGPVGTSFQVTWSSAAAPSGFVFDVQIAKPGQPFKDWSIGTTHRQRKISPSLPGRYRFRARLRMLIDNSSSQYSPPSEFRVN